MTLTAQQQLRAATAILFVVWSSPLWLFTYPPAVDLPNHMAITDVLARLLTDDPDVASYYALNLQPTPYHLYYLLAVPLTLAVGAVASTKLVLTGAVLSFFAGVHLSCRALRKPWPVVALASLWLYNVTFFYGFVTSFLGISLLVFGIGVWASHLAAPRKQWLVVATITGLLVCSSNVCLVPAWGCVLAAVIATDPRRQWKAVAIVGAISAMPVVPWLLFGGGQSSTGPGIGPALRITRGVLVPRNASGPAR